MEGVGKSSSVRRSEPPAPKAEKSEEKAPKNESEGESSDVGASEAKHERTERTEEKPNVEASEGKHQRIERTEEAPNVEASEARHERIHREETTSQEPAPRDEFVDPSTQNKPVELQPGAKPAGEAPQPDKAQNESVPGALVDFAQRHPEVAQLAAQGKLRETMDATLNSEGDSLTLKLSVQGTTGVGVNGGAGVGSEVKVSRTKDGYELAVQGEGKGIVGAEVSEGVEASGEASLAVSPKFKFNTAEEAQKGLEALARSGSKLATSPSALLGDLAMDTAAGAVENGARAAADTVDNVPLIGGPTARALNGMADGAQGVDNQSTSSEDLNYLRQHLHSVTVQGALAGELAANLGLPGVQLHNLGAGVTGKVQQSQSLEIELGPPPAASYDEAVQLSAKAHMGSGTGLAGDASLTVKSHTKAELDRSVDPMGLLGSKKPVLSTGLKPRVTESTTSLEVNGRARGVQGLGVSADMGGGLKTTVTVDNLKNAGALDRALTPEALEAARGGDLKPALNNLGNASVDVKSELYGTSGMNLLAAVSYAGNGGKVEGEARWEDILQTSQMTVTGSQAADAVKQVEQQVSGMFDEEHFDPFPAGSRRGRVIP